MTREELEKDVIDGNYDSEYATYIMENASSDKIICNGDMLIVAMEDGYMFEEFCDNLEKKLDNKV